MRQEGTHLFLHLSRPAPSGGERQRGGPKQGSRSETSPIDPLEVERRLPNIRREVAARGVTTPVGTARAWEKWVRSRYKIHLSRR
jgi:hypothetical protein